MAEIGKVEVRSARDGDAQVIELIGELDIDGAPTVEAELQRAEASDAAAIVVDLSRLSFIDSSGIRVIVMAAQRQSADNGRFQLMRGPAAVHRVFEITDLVNNLPFVDG